MYSDQARHRSARLRSLLTDKGNVGLLVGSGLTVASLFVPWWSLHSSVVNGQQALFDFTIGPLGMDIHTIVGDPRTLFAGLNAVYLVVTIALLPVSVSLGLGAFHGVYCAVRGRRGVRVLIAPLWAVIGLTWWAFYFLLVYSLLSSLGLNIPQTGSADVTWQSYQLAGAAWGWDLGLWLGIGGTAVLFVGGALSLRGAKAAAPLAPGTRLAFGVHGIGLILLALLNLGALALLLASLRNNGITWLVLVPVLLLFAMAVFARRPKAVAVPRKPFVPALPKIPKASFTLPKITPPAWTGGGSAAAPRPEALAQPSELTCPTCGQRFPNPTALEAHKLTHTVAAQAAEARKKMDDFGKKLLGR